MFWVSLSLSFCSTSLFFHVAKVPEENHRGLVDRNFLLTGWGTDAHDNHELCIFVPVRELSTFV